MRDGTHGEARHTRPPPLFQGGQCIQECFDIGGEDDRPLAKLSRGQATISNDAVEGGSADAEPAAGLRD